jgi:glycerol-3-phosphate cytidylyltransferase-like family protein
VIARDTNVKKFKGTLPHFRENIRKKHIEKINIADIVVLGDSKDPLKWVKKYSPKVICL